jgi:hypothetical protein
MFPGETLQSRCDKAELDEGEYNVVGESARADPATSVAIERLGPDGGATSFPKILAQ